MATMKRYGLRPVIQKDEAVSPIIATILLVAITVILASTLYLALGGFFTSKTSATPTVGLSTASGSTSGTYVITVGSTSSNAVPWTSVKVEILSGTTEEFSFVNSGGTWTVSTSLTLTTGDPAASLSATTDTYVTSGDTLTFTPNLSNYTSPPTPTTVEFFYTGSSAGDMGSASL